MQKKVRTRRTLKLLRSQCPEGNCNVTVIAAKHYSGKRKDRRPTPDTPGSRTKKARTRRAPKSVEESPVFEGTDSLRKSESAWLSRGIPFLVPAIACTGVESGCNAAARRVRDHARFEIRICTPIGGGHLPPLDRRAPTARLPITCHRYLSPAPCDRRPLIIDYRSATACQQRPLTDCQLRTPTPDSDSRLGLPAANHAACSGRSACRWLRASSNSASTPSRVRIEFIRRASDSTRRQPRPPGTPRYRPSICRVAAPI